MLLDLWLIPSDMIQTTDNSKTRISSIVKSNWADEAKIARNLRIYLAQEAAFMAPRSNKDTGIRMQSLRQCRESMTFWIDHYRNIHGASGELSHGVKYAAKCTDSSRNHEETPPQSSCPDSLIHQSEIWHQSWKAQKDIL